MKAAVLRQYGRLEIEDVVLDGPTDDEVRIRVEASGLCHSDYHIILGDMPLPLPIVLGHESAGVVETVGANVPGLEVGDRVVTCLSAYCGHCSQCQTGHSHRCDEKPGARAASDAPRIATAGGGQPIMPLGNLGGFAEEMVVHHRSVVKLPEGVPAAAAALLGCAVLTGVGAVVNGARVEPGATVAVIGCGGGGLNVVQGAVLAGAARVIAIDLSEEKLALASTFGATDTVTGGEDAVAAVRELTRGGVDYAFEVIGLPTTVNDAIAMLRKGGTAVLVGVGALACMDIQAGRALSCPVPRYRPAQGRKGRRAKLWTPACAGERSLFYDPHAECRYALGAGFSAPITPFVLAEKRIIGTMMGSSPFQLFIPQLAEYYRRGRLKLDELISARIPLEQINEGYARMAEGKVARSVIVF